MKYTDKFNSINLTDEANIPQITPDRVFYKIDDFTVTQDTSKINVDTSIKTLKDLWGKSLSKYINNNMKIFLDKDIPVITIEEYLRELKDICAGKALTTKRFTVRHNNSIRVDHVIILNKYKDHYVLMNEVYQNDKFLKAIEYNLNEMLKKYSTMV